MIKNITNKSIPLLGIGSAVVYALTIVIGGLSRADYRLFIDPISRIFARGLPNSTLIGLFLTMGNILAIIMAIGIFIARKNKTIKTSMVALALSGITGAILFNFFPMDPWLGLRTAADIVHNDVFASVVLLIWVAMVIFYFGARVERRLKGLKNYFLVTMIVFSVLILIGFLSWTYFTYLTGSIESLFLIVFLQWIVFLSLRV